MGQTQPHQVSKTVLRDIIGIQVTATEQTPPAHGSGFSWKLLRSQQEVISQGAHSHLQGPAWTLLLALTLSTQLFWLLCHGLVIYSHEIKSMQSFWESVNMSKTLQYWGVENCDSAPGCTGTASVSHGLWTHMPIMVWVQPPWPIPAWPHPPSTLTPAAAPPATLGNHPDTLVTWLPTSTPGLEPCPAPLPEP